MPKIYVLHVHPDPKINVKRRTYTYNCTSDNGCTAVGAQRVSIGFGGPWTVRGRAAWPVLCNGTEIDNPFDTGLTIPVGNACAGDHTYVIQYDYVSNSYSMNAYTFKEFYNGNTAGVSPAEAYAVFPHITSYDNNGKPVWRTELDIDKNGKYIGSSVTVGYRGHAGPAGVAIDYRAIKGWYPEIRTFISNVSEIMIGRQTQYGSSVDQQRYYTDNIDGVPTQVPYRITGPSTGFSGIISNISVQLVVKQPSPTPPGPKQWGTVIVTTWHEEGYVVGADIYSMNYGPSKNTLGGSIGQSRCSFVSQPTTHSLMATVYRNGMMLFGTANVTVEVFKAVEAKIVLEEVYLTDNNVYAVTEVEYEDDTGATIQGYGQIDTGMTISHLGLVAGSVGVTQLTEVVGGSLVPIKNCIGTNVNVIQTLVGGEISSIGKLPKALAYAEHVGFQGKIVYLPYEVKRIMTSSGWMEPWRWAKIQQDLFDLALQQAKYGPDRFKMFGDAVVQKMNSGVLLVGAGINTLFANFVLQVPEEPETPEDAPDYPPEDKPDDEYIPEYTPPNNIEPINNPYDPPVIGPVVPEYECIKTVNPETKDSEDPFPEPPEIIPTDDDDDPITNPTAAPVYSYVLESQAMLLGSGYPMLCRLYAFSGIVTGVKGDIMKVGYSRNTHVVENVNYKANAPLGILCLNKRGEAISGGAKIVDNTTIEIQIGVAESECRYVLMGEFDSNYIPPSTGRFICNLQPTVAGRIRVVAYPEGVETEVYSGTGPTIDIDIVPGNYTVFASCAGYTTANASFTILGGEETSVILVMVPITITKKFISFKISSTYTNSEIRINGRHIGVGTPCGYGVTITGYTVFKFEASIVINGHKNIGIAVMAVDMNSASYYEINIKQSYWGEAI